MLNGATALEALHRVTDGTLWIVGTLAGAGGTLMAVAAAVYFDRTKRAGRPFSGPEAENLASVRRDAEELSELLAARMDQKAAQIEELLGEADRRIVRLRTLLREQEVEPKARPRQGPRPSADESDTRARIMTEVYRLADSGRSVVEIARAVGEPTGNVELMLALRKV
jgi:hypothetical protein